MDSRLYYFAGGGTGGHLFPGLAVAQAIRNREPQTRITFIGSERSQEHDLVARHGFEHLGLPAEPLTRLRRNPIAFFWRNWRAYRHAKRLLKETRPTAVVGLGGFASAPVVLAAHRLGIATVLLEQNSIPGRSTRWLSRWANCVCLSYPQSHSYFSSKVSTQLTGNPVRTEIAELAKQQHAQRTVEQRPDRPLLLILGGSQGAQPLNEAVLWMLKAQPQLLAGWRIVHQTGSAQQEIVQQRYRELGLEVEVAAFLQDMAERYRLASLVISRAGATTLAELACVGIPAILVPYPFAADNHQWHNARAFEVAGAGLISLQGTTMESSGRVLLERLQAVLSGPEVLSKMSAAMSGLGCPEATEKVLQVLDEVAARGARF